MGGRVDDSWHRDIAVVYIEHMPRNVNLVWLLPRFIDPYMHAELKQSASHASRRQDKLQGNPNHLIQLPN